MNVVFHTLPGSHNPTIRWEDDYTAPWRDEAVIAALPEGAWDGEVVRLARYESGPGTRPQMVLQRARYFDYIGTNLSPKDCERTDALGIATLLFTADGHCILQRRSPDLAIRPGLLGPSMSGTVKPDDFKGATLLSQLDARREIREELGVSSDEILYLHLMGLIREPERAGAPELMYRGTLSLTAAELQDRESEEGELLFVDVMKIRSLPGRTPPVDNLLAMLIREDMSR
ncbi:MAG: hypothetical protein P8R54_23740 [Myxococcota bacterium]|nr:hypothetical protein [Myxococcota bacterium]